MTDETILSAIGSTEPSSFNEFCSALGSDRPDNKDDWRDLFGQLNKLEFNGLVIIDRDANRKIGSLVLTTEGSNLIRATMDNKRGLFSAL